MGNKTSKSDETYNPYDPEFSASSFNQHPPSTMSTASQSLGNNRLATGFVKPGPVLVPDTQVGENDPTSSSNAVSTPGASADDAIGISDDEESSEGGDVVINVDSATHDEYSEEMAIDAEEGEISENQEGASEPHPAARETTNTPSHTGQDAHMQLGADLNHIANAIPNSLSIPATHANTTGYSGLRLADLSPDDLDLQLKYALFDVDRDQIDLSRPAVCLACLRADHTEQLCPEKTCQYCAAVGQHSSRLCPKIRRCAKCRERGHTAESCTANLGVTTVPCDLCGSLKHLEDACPHRFFPAELNVNSGPVRLWISCCVCASKSHLVGDCPSADRDAAFRWSLQSFAPGQITNLTLEPSTREREKRAENRGMRPEGLRIRGRAGVHNARRSRYSLRSDSDSDEEFLRPRVQNHDSAKRGGFTFRHAHRMPSPPINGSRYDRPGRTANNWYATDSFGHYRSRSRSPQLGGGQRAESDDFRRRSRSPRGFDGYRPGRRRSPSPRPRDDYRPASGNTPTAFRGGAGSAYLKQDITIQLPVRRGSDNLSIQNASTDSSAPPRPQQSNATSNQTNSAGSKKKKSKKGKANANTNRAEQQQSADATKPGGGDSSSPSINGTPAVILTDVARIPKEVLQGYVSPISDQRKSFHLGRDRKVGSHHLRYYKFIRV
ncbi:uncharacterized protein Z518_09253 [Rhinocladiella mackenziei CBS 650.93]|uniref:CCHC-type domain-containing protein n=1 Tax=Rhinocladiella mackenziei CBS 650.93 TaxID=1442369 RepID=A0A0D2FHU8_9EURO|nr:uncharacterized protein Z518_09253 [Rhinocladiella mackenziei CBS 650.93]KIX01527.1 hypothetical protein Z518_09253 [Rhinocladiella mackenziei CBS 650.93]